MGTALPSHGLLHTLTARAPSSLFFPHPPQMLFLLPEPLLFTSKAHLSRQPSSRLLQGAFLACRLSQDLLSLWLPIVYEHQPGSSLRAGMETCIHLCVPSLSWSLAQSRQKGE